MVPRSAMGSVGGETHGSVTEGPAAPSADGTGRPRLFEDEAIRDSRSARRVDSGLEGSPGEVSIFDLESIFAASPGTPRRTLSAERARARKQGRGPLEGFFPATPTTPSTPPRRGPRPAFVEVVEERGEGRAERLGGGREDARERTAGVHRGDGPAHEASRCEADVRGPKRIVVGIDARRKVTRRAGAAETLDARGELGFRRLRLFKKRRGAFVFFRRLIAHTLHEPRALEPVETAAQLSENLRADGRFRTSSKTLGTAAASSSARFSPRGRAVRRSGRWRTKKIVVRFRRFRFRFRFQTPGSRFPAFPRQPISAQGSLSAFPSKQSSTNTRPSASARSPRARRERRRTNARREKGRAHDEAFRANAHSRVSRGTPRKLEPSTRSRCHF